MKPSQRLIVCSAVYFAAMTTVVVAAQCTLEYPADYVSGLILASMLLVAMFAALSSVRAAYRISLSAIGVAYLSSLLAWITDIIDLPIDRSLYLLTSAAVMSLITGLMLPVRGYWGTIRLPTDSALSKPTIFFLLATVSFFAVVATLFTFIAASNQIAAIVIGTFGWTTCMGPILAMLSESKSKQILGAVLMIASIGVAVVSVLNAPQVMFCEVALGMAPPVVVPMCAVFVLRLNGYRLTR